MPKKIYVGNLPFSASDDEVRSMFSRFGKVARVEMRRGSAIIEMADDRAASQAIRSLHQSEMDGKSLNVNEARPR
jgi:RNA recognition motif-containing protein